MYKPLRVKVAPSRALPVSSEVKSFTDFCDDFGPFFICCVVIVLMINFYIELHVNAKGEDPFFYLIGIILYIELVVKALFKLVYKYFIILQAIKLINEYSRGAYYYLIYKLNLTICYSNHITFNNIFTYY